MEIIFESNTTEPTEFILPDGEEVINFGHVMIVEGNPFAAQS
jgi:hypothetical protein